MRVVHVMPAASIAASGPTYSVTRLCGSLIDRGLNVELAALQWGGGHEVPQFCREFPLGAGPRRLGRSPQMLRWLRTQVASGSVDGPTIERANVVISGWTG